MDLGLEQQLRALERPGGDARDCRHPDGGDQPARATAWARAALKTAGRQIWSAVARCRLGKGLASRHGLAACLLYTSDAADE